MSAPMSMEEWQNRLRAQKQQDRKSKTQSAEILHSYRGSIKDEGEIQKKLRLEELQKKKDAAEYLHKYRPNVDNIDALSPKHQSASSLRYEHDGPLPPIVATPSKDDPRNAILAGSVSSIAANFNSSGGVAVSPETIMAASHDAAAAAAKTPPQAPTPPKGASAYMSDSSQTEGTSEWVQITTEEVSSPNVSSTSLTAGDAMEETSDLDEANIEAKPALIVEDDMHVIDKETTVDPSAIAEVFGDGFNPPSDDDPKESDDLFKQSTIAPEKPPSDIHHQSEPTQPTTTSGRRLDIDFSFGLISSKAHTSLDAYMQAVQEVVQGALNENVEMRQFIAYDPWCTPYVQNIGKDETFVDSGGRCNVQRLLVKAAVPIFLTTDRISAKKARYFVIKALAAALKKGYFLDAASEGR